MLCCPVLLCKRDFHTNACLFKQEWASPTSRPCSTSSGLNACLRVHTAIIFCYCNVHPCLPECCLYRRFVFPATQLQCTALFRTTGTAYCSLLMSSADRQYFVSLQLHACMIAVDSQAVNEHLYTAQSWTKPRRGA